MNTEGASPCKNLDSIGGESGDTSKREDSPISDYGARENYLLRLLDISEKLARGEETPFNLLRELEELNSSFPQCEERYSKQSSDLGDRLRLHEEEGRYDSLIR